MDSDFVPDPAAAEPKPQVRVVDAGGVREQHVYHDLTGATARSICQITTFTADLRVDPGAEWCSLCRHFAPTSTEAGAWPAQDGDVEVQR